MTHPFDLDPNNTIACAAWNEVRQPQQPEYANLPVDFKSRLLETAARVRSGDPMVLFETAVAEKLKAEPEAEPETVATEAAPEAVAAESEAAPVDAGTTDPDAEADDVAAVEDNAEAADEKPDPPVLPKGPLPADFPALDKLHAAATPINTYGQLAKVEDLTSIDGIGIETAKKIKKRVRDETRALNK